MYPPEYLVIALSTLGLLLQTRVSHFRDAYEQASKKERALRAAISELRRLRESEAQARKEAEEANRVKSQFLAHVSHEVRTPLNAISSTVQMLRQTPLTAEQKEYVDLLVTGSETLEAILGNILDFARIEAGKVELDRQPVNVCEAVDEAMKLVQPLAAAQGLAFARDIKDDVPEMFNADPVRLRQILLNLLSNAVKFTDCGSVTVTVSCTAAQDNGDGALRFAVCDTGPGISANHQEQIFQPFMQANNAGAARKGGAGLGLAITKELVHLMGGEISVQSEVGEGSTFVFTVPLVAR